AINPVEYSHTMETLSVVEGAATGLAAPHLSSETIEHATDINNRLRTSLRDFDPFRYTKLNHEFHQTLYMQCPNPHLLDLVQRGWDRLAAIRESSFSFVPGRAEESVAEHDQLLGLLRSGADPAEIERAAREHRAATMRAFLANEKSDGNEANT